MVEAIQKLVVEAIRDLVGEVGAPCLVGLVEVKVPSMVALVEEEAPSRVCQVVEAFRTPKDQEGREEAVVPFHQVISEASCQFEVADSLAIMVLHPSSLCFSSHIQACYYEVEEVKGCTPPPCLLMPLS